MKKKHVVWFSPMAILLSAVKSIYCFTNKVFEVVAKERKII